MSGADVALLDEAGIIRARTLSDIRRPAGVDCGVVALWTRRPAAEREDPPQSGDGFHELRFLAALGAVILTFLLTR